ncbi:MAG: L-sorbose 1-phosphate reductase [Ruminococcaceae bacterium]|nr:L-sorbose 1-phosphate reductase [Oscillospiraceae bacterium]
MKTKAVRLYGVNDLRLEEFELPELREDEILAKVISDSIYMSTHKAALQGAEHKRVPDNVAQNPVIVGHEFCGVIEKVGSKWADQYKEGERFIVQTNLNLEENPLAAPGYSFPYIGGDATHIVIPNAVMEKNCLLPYAGDAFFYGSLSEPMSCIIGGFHANYHTVRGKYEHSMGIVEGGNCAILAGAGPMGLGAIDYALHGDRRPGLLVVTDIDDMRLKRAAGFYTPEDAAEHGVRLVYLNTNTSVHPENTNEAIRALTGGRGFDDVFVFAPVKPVVEQGDALLGQDGCLNFFAGPTKTDFSAMFNFYNVHYASTHIVGTSGGNTENMFEYVSLMNQGRLNPAAMITHVGGLNCIAEAVVNLDKIPGGKKLAYTQIDMPLTAIDDMAELGETDPLMASLADLIARNNGLWCAEAEKFLLENAKPIR